MWRRYRRPAALAVPLGAAVGVAICIAIYLTGNPDYRAYGGWGAFLSLVAVGCAIGAGTALFATAGSALALAIWDRPVTKSAGSRRVAGSIGAAGGAALLWLGFGVVNGLVSPTGWSWFGLTGVAIAVSAPIAAIIAGVLIARADKRAGAVRR